MPPLLAVDDGPIHRELLGMAAQCPEIQVFYLSGYTNHTFVHHGIQPGLAFLRKPFTPDRLLREVLERGRGGGDR